MILREIVLEADTGGWTLSALAIRETGRRESHRIWFHCPEADGVGLSERADPFLATLLVPCMMLGERLSIEGTVSPQLLANAERLQDIYAIWLKKARRIQVAASTIQPAVSLAHHSLGCFFSGGVDSFFSLLRNKDRITHLILIRGFDAALRNDLVWRTTLASVRRVAEAEGRRLLQVQTNLREFTDPIIGWEHYSGNVLGAVALFFSSLLRSVIVPASATYSQLVLIGSHPLIEPNWQNEAIAIEFDGCETSRLEKVRDTISHSGLALDNLYVCWSPRNREANCGRCEKCLRTSLELEAAAVFGRCATFKGPLDRRRLRRLRYNRPSWLDYIREVEAGIRANNPSLSGILDHIIARSGALIAKEIMKGRYR